MYDVDKLIKDRYAGTRPAWLNWPYGREGHNVMYDNRTCPICARPLLAVKYIPSLSEHDDSYELYLVVCTFCKTKYTLRAERSTVTLSSGDETTDRINALEARITELEALVRRMAVALENAQKHQDMPRHQDEVTAHEVQKPDHEAADFIAKYHYLL